MLRSTLAANAVAATGGRLAAAVAANINDIIVTSMFHWHNVNVLLRFTSTIELKVRIQRICTIIVVTRLACASHF